MNWRWIIYLSLAVIFAACAPAPPESAMDAASSGTPSQWSASREARAGVDKNWVKRFGDRQLNQLVKEALLHNYDMQIAAERVYRAGESANIAGAAGRPMANVGANTNKQKLNNAGGSSGNNRDVVDTHGVQLNVEWEPDIWGRVRAGQSAAIAEWQAGGLDYEAARASLAAQVCKAWFALAESQEQVALAQKALGIRRQTETAVRERFEMSMRAEGGSASQLRLAQTDVATAKADLSMRQGTLESSRRQLELLVGRYPAGKLRGKLKLPTAPTKPPSGLPSELLLRRPDILAAERRYASSIKRIREAELAVFPSFKLTASGGSSSDALSSIINSNFGVWSLGASVSQVLLAGGQIRGEVRLRESNQREALARLHKTVLNAFGEVEQTLVSELYLQRREQEMHEALKLAREASLAAEDDYRDGNGDVLTLFVAQSRHIQLESSYTALRLLRLTNRVDLHLSLGGGFSLSR